MNAQAIAAMYVITLLNKGYFAELTDKGFRSTWEIEEAEKFNSISDAQAILNKHGLYPQPGIFKASVAQKLIEEWQKKQSAVAQ